MSPRYRKPSDGPTYAEKVAMGRNEAEAHVQWRDHQTLRCPQGHGWCARVECRDGCTANPSHKEVASSLGAW